MNLTGYKIRIVTEYWDDDQCPVEAVTGIKRRAPGLYEVLLDKNLYPYQAEAAFIHLEDMLILQIGGGLEIPDVVWDDLREKRCQACDR